MSSSSLALYGAVRSRLLNHVASPSFAQLLPGGIHTNAPPENAAYPYAVLSIYSAGTGTQDDANIGEQGTIEVMLFGRGRQQLVTLGAAADLAEVALWKWTTDGAGWLSVRERESRSMLPPMPQPANVEIVRLRVVWRYTWWPEFRRALARDAGT